MTAPVLAHKKFYIIKPAAGTNQLKNPIFSPPDHAEDWVENPVGATVETTGDEQRFGAYSMKVNPVTGVASYAYYGNLTVVSGTTYTFSAYVKGTAGQAMRIYIRLLGSPYTVRATKTFTATGYWQRQQVTWTADVNSTAECLMIQRDAVASTDPFYVDGVQFEQASAATTLMEGYMPGCRWEGYARNSSSIRSAQYRKGGEIVDLSDYCEIVQVTGLGHGDWNQILTKMTSGGDMYQTHTRKSRNFSIIVDFTGNSLREIEANRKAVIDLIRPDLLTGQEMIVRYQGVDVNGDEATNPVDIVCVPLPATLVDTPDLPSYQRAVLNFTIPSGLLNGAYNEGAELDLYADFPAEYIVKRDADGNWCKWTGSAYENLITNIEDEVNCLAEGPDGKIYAGGDHIEVGGMGVHGLRVWNNLTETWGELLLTDWTGGVQLVNDLCFDAAGDLYFCGTFSSNILYPTLFNLAKCRCGTGSNEIVPIAGYTDSPFALAMSPSGDLYIGGGYLEKWDGTSFTTLHNFAGGSVRALAFAPNGDLYIGGTFTDTAHPYLCKWDGSSMSPVGVVGDISGGLSWTGVTELNFDNRGLLFVGGNFTNAHGIADADFIAQWNGMAWDSVGGGLNNMPFDMCIRNGKLYVAGFFTKAGSLSLTDRIAIYSNGAWQPIDIELPGTSSMYAILAASDGSLYISGNFSTTTASENAKTGIVTLNLNVSSASANTYPFMQVRGPGTLKAITNYSTGKSVMFDGLTLQPGEWINLFFDPLNLIFQGGWSGRGNLMRYVVPGSDYGDFYLMPGSNLLSLFMTDSTTDSGAFMSWTPLFWGIDGALL